MLQISIRNIAIALKAATLVALTTVSLLAAAQPPLQQTPLQQTTTASSTDPFTLTIAGSPAVDVGAAANLLVTVAPQSISIDPVKLSCSGLPSESTCTFGEPMLPVNGGTTNLQITTTAPHDYGSAVPYFQSAIPFAAPALAGLLFLPRRRRKSLKAMLIVLIALCGVSTLTGCGNSTDLGTRPGDYTISITGTSTEVTPNVVITKFVLHVAVP